MIHTPQFIEFLNPITTFSDKINYKIILIQDP